MDFKLEDLTPEQINILNRFNKNDIINNLLVLEHQKEKRNNFY